MRTKLNKSMSLAVILTLLVTMALPAFPGSAAASETPAEPGLSVSSVTNEITGSDETPASEEEDNTVLNSENQNDTGSEISLSGNGLSDLTMEPIALEEPLPAEDFVPVEPEEPAFTYGPYRESDPKPAHAYEPFKENTTNSSKQTTARFKEDQLLIKMTSTALQSGKYESQSGSVPFNAEGVVALEPLMPNNIGVMSVKENDPGIKASTEGTWYTAELRAGTDVLAAASAISSQPGVIAAEPDYIRSTMADGIPDAATDDRMGEQWQLERSNVTQAWSYLQSQGIDPGGSRDVVVAVIDTGVDYTHPDLTANMWTNSGEIPDNGIDDDNNGYVDDVYGACTVGNSFAGESGDPQDDHGHGTHVAGIIAAAGGNGGTVGVAYNVQIMAVKAAQSSGVLTSSDIAQAIYYAVENGADVINMSFGGYGRSTVEEDALQVAFGQAVLVAAAGNGGIPNLPMGKDMFPAAYPWVLGVMAERPEPAANGDNLAEFSNWDSSAQDSHEYEVMAPGVGILSTLPGGKYASWSGTSMAAPVVSGIAALVRSKFTDKDSYSSRFIMGQIACTGEFIQGITPDSGSPIYYYEVNAFEALTGYPEPKLSFLEYYVVDGSDIDAANNGDGIVDAGETIDLGMVIRNHWGKADPVQVKIDSLGSGGMSDPFDFGAVANFATDDNGLIYTDDVVTGVSSPFQLRVAENTPNDHVIPINITLSGKNGLDPEDPKEYTFRQQMTLIVRNGVVLPDVISQDMTLTADKYWIVPNATIIEEGAAVIVEPGTQIQFWSSQPEDPYAEKPMTYIQVKGSLLVNGTAEEPVEMFASGLYPGYEVKIFATDQFDL